MNKTESFTNRSGLHEGMQCSVVMALYNNDNPEWLKQAIESILNQTTKSNNIVIVRDGTIPEELEKILRAYDDRYKEISIVRLEDNVGAGQARNEGVKHAKHELVAIMDADDISLPNRFELQLAEFKKNPELALVGGQIAEFENTPDNVVGYRKVPTEYDAVRKFARHRSPINHVTIMFKKTAFLAVGGYPKMTRAEDYYMISSLLARSYLICNLQTSIVNCRTSSDNIRRRKTWRNVHENIVSRWKIHKLGTMSLADFCMSSLGQIVLLIMPSSTAKALFKVLLRSKT